MAPTAASGFRFSTRRIVMMRSTPVLPATTLGYIVLGIVVVDLGGGGGGGGGGTYTMITVLNIYRSNSKKRMVFW